MTTNPLLLDFPDRFETDRLLVRAPRAGDGPALHEAVLETIDALRTWMDWAVPEQHVDMLEEFARRGASTFIARTDFPMLIWLKDEQRLVGVIGLHPADWSVPLLEIGYWCRASCEGQGFVSEAVRGITRFAFNQLGARRLEIRCDARNERSARVAERCGYQLEGRFRGNELDTSGELSDTLIYARIRSDPPLVEESAR